MLRQPLLAVILAIAALTGCASFPQPPANARYDDGLDCVFRPIVTADFGKV